MALLRNLEQSLSGLVEGTIGRVFRTEVRPTEIARKLAREMEINKRVSLSRTYAPTDYIVYLSPDDRARYTGVEHSIAEELGAYLLEHARRERLVLVRRPLVEFRTDQRLRLGEFGIEARTAPISAEEAPPRADPLVDEARAPARPAPEQRVAEQNFPPPSHDEPEFRPASPLGTPAEPEPEPVDMGPLEEEPAYADPYAGDPFGGDDSSQPDDYGWEDVARDEEREREPEPEPVSAEPEVWEPELADESAPAADAEPHPSEPEPEPEPAPAAQDDADWLDPVEDWVPQPAAPPAPAEPEMAAEPIEPRSPVLPPEPMQPIAGAPWIDPTLARQQRPPLPPPVLPPRRRADTVLLVDGTPHELHGDRVVLGRSRTADIVVSDPSISRQHLELRRDDRGWYAVDLGSTNGTEVDDTPVAEPRRLDKGMRIKLGHATAIIEVR